MLYLLITEQFLWVVSLSQCEIKCIPCHVFEVKLFTTNTYSIIAVISYIYIHTQNRVLFSIKTGHQKEYWHNTQCVQMHSFKSRCISLENNRINTVLLYRVTHLDILYIAINVFDILLWVLVQVYAVTVSVPKGTVSWKNATRGLYL